MEVLVAMRAGFCLAVSTMLPFLMRSCAKLPAMLLLQLPAIEFATCLCRTGRKVVSTYIEHREGILCLSQRSCLRGCNVLLMPSQANTSPIADREGKSESNELQQSVMSAFVFTNIVLPDMFITDPSDNNSIIVHADSFDHPNP